MTESDISGHLKTEGGDEIAAVVLNKELSIEQLNAVELLLTGRTDQEVGEAVGVSRQTICRWRNQHFRFIAELNQRRERLWDAQRERLRHLVSRAVDVLADDLGSEDDRLRLAAAVHVLKATGLYGTDLQPSGPTDAVDLETRWLVDEKLRLIGKGIRDRQVLQVVALRDRDDERSGL